MAFKFVHPSTILISGPTGSGKTQFLFKILEHKLIDPFPTKIYFVYGEWQDIYDQMQNSFDSIEFFNVWNENIYKNLNKRERNLIILDDQMTKMSANKTLSELFTEGSHHRNLTVVYIVQNLFNKSPQHRTIALNSHYLVLFKNPRDKGQIGVLARQMSGSSSKFLVDSYIDATSEPYGYILIDFRPETSDEFRVLSKIFPNEAIEIYQPA